MKIVSTENLDIPSLLHHFEKGVVVIPTETVYGLAAPINNEKLLLEIFKVKNRPADNPLIVHVSSIEMLKTVIDGDIPIQYTNIIKKCWPGPISLLFKANKSLSEIVTAGLNTVLVRIPDNKVVLEIIEQLGVPLAAPSANLSGKPSPSCISHTSYDFKDKVELYIDGGDCKVGLESTVFSYLNNDPIILRPGGVSKEELELLINQNIKLKNKSGEGMMSPGLKYKHYSPKTEFVVILQESTDMLDIISEYTKGKEKKIGILSHFNNSSLFDKKNKNLQIFDLGENLTKVASNLYKGLRFLDNKCDIIFMYKLPNDNEGEAVMDRIIKAAHNIIN